MLPYFNDLFREQQNEIDDYNKEIKTTVFYGMRQAFATVPDIYKNYIGDVSEEHWQAILSDPYLKNKTVKYILDLETVHMQQTNIVLLVFYCIKK
ncbi:MAG: hypothetical protein ACI83B_004148 [Sediminicola sp.]